MPKTLLLADDSITIQRVVSITFANEDYEITTVDNGDDAVIKAAEIKPDVVLADVIMPKKNGYEVCQAIKQNPELKNIPVLLLAGTFEAFDENRSREVGANGHITKPFESQALIDKVNELIESSMQTSAPIPGIPSAITMPQPTQQPPGAEIAPPMSIPAMPRTPPPPPNIPAPTLGAQQPGQTPLPPFGREPTQPRATVPQSVPPPAPKIPPPGLNPLENTTPPQPKPLEPRAVKATPIEHTPFKSTAWEPDNQDVDFLEPLAEEETKNQAANLSSKPISLDLAQEEPIPLEVEPLDLSMPDEPSIDDPWPSTPSPLADRQSVSEEKPFEPMEQPLEPYVSLDDSITSGNLAELTQAENPLVDVEEEKVQDFDLEPPELAPAHEFVPQMQPVEEPQETVKLPVEVPSISLEEAKKIAAQTIEKIAWEIVPQLAEAIIREEIEKLIKEKLKG